MEYHVGRLPLGFRFVSLLLETQDLHFTPILDITIIILFNKQKKLFPREVFSLKNASDLFTKRRASDLLSLEEH